LVDGKGGTSISPMADMDPVKFWVTEAIRSSFKRNKVMFVLRSLSKSPVLNIDMTINMLI
jgi:hypothetical protein